MGCLLAAPPSWPELAKASTWDDNADIPHTQLLRRLLLIYFGRSSVIPSIALIMPSYHVSSASRALYRVFIAPNLNLTRRSFASPISKPTISPPHTAVRTKFYKRDTRRHAIGDTYTLDNAISALRINFIDINGRFHQDIATVDAQQSLNRTTHHLVLVSPGRMDEYGQPDPNFLPTCKAISKIDLRNQHQKKLDIERRKAKGQGVGPSSKNLELNWAIAGGDLKHRLEKMKEFLREGRKVELLLGPKRRGRVASVEECRKVMAAVREAVGECKGAGEAKEPEGKIGGVMTLVFEGRKMENEKEKA